MWHDTRCALLYESYLGRSRNVWRYVQGKNGSRGMQCPPIPGPGLHAWKPKGFVLAAPITSRILMSILPASNANSLIKLMFTKRYVFFKYFHHFGYTGGAYGIYVADCPLVQCHSNFKSFRCHCSQYFRRLRFINLSHLFQQVAKGVIVLFRLVGLQAILFYQNNM